MKRPNKTKKSVYERFLTEHYIGYVDRAANEHIDLRVKRGLAKLRAEADPVAGFLLGFCTAFILGILLSIALHYS